MLLLMISSRVSDFRIINSQTHYLVVFPVTVCLLMQVCRAPTRHPVQSRRGSCIHAELPSVSGLADAGLGLTEGALPGSVDTEPSSSNWASNGSPQVQKGQIIVKTEHLPNSHLRLEVTVPADLLKKAEQKALKQLRADAKDIPGFRKGKKVLHRFMLCDSKAVKTLAFNHVSNILKSFDNQGLPCCSFQK